MIAKDELNEDQRKSFEQITTEAGLTEEKALELIQELCIDKGFTGLKVEARFVLTPQGKMAALNLLSEMPIVKPHGN
ncbi:hypothetical protein ES708_18461 [subsurface metagenome]